MKSRGAKLLRLVRDSQLVSNPAKLRSVWRELYNERFGSVDFCLMEGAVEECKASIQEMFPEETDLEPQKRGNMFITAAHFQKCRGCAGRCSGGALEMQFEHRLDGWHMRCKRCTEQWPNCSFDLQVARFTKLASALADFGSDDIRAFPDDRLKSLFVAALNGSDVSLARFAAHYFKDAFTWDGEGWSLLGDPSCSSLEAEAHFVESLCRPPFTEHFKSVAIRFETMPRNEVMKRKAFLLRKLCFELECLELRTRIVELSKQELLSGETRCEAQGIPKKVTSPWDIMAAATLDEIFWIFTDIAGSSRRS